MRQRRDTGPGNEYVSGVNSSYTNDGNLVIRALRETDGHCSCPTDEETYQTQIRLATEEGIFAEPAGALTVAGLICDIRDKKIDPDQTIVCVVTSSGLKDTDTAERLFLQTKPRTIHFTELNRLPSLVSDGETRGQ